MNKLHLAARPPAPPPLGGRGGEAGQDEGRGPELGSEGRGWKGRGLGAGSEGRSWKGAWPTETQFQVLQQSTFQIQACPAISQSRWSLRLQQLFVLRPGTDNGSFITQATFETRPDKAVAISVKSHPELARKTGPSLAEELQASFGLGGQLPPPWPWLQGLLPGLSLPRAFGGSTPHVPHRAPHCGNISCPP